MSDFQNEAVAMPTKRFFVSMLTRDISLADAILDLVDNCLDGALRVSNGEGVDYSKFNVNITLDEDHFEIEDDCGGIPREIVSNYAFKMGREPDDNRDNDNETIGMYGVGMKRAIFKMGRTSEVYTLHEEDSMMIPIHSDWLENKEWDNLPIQRIEKEVLSKPGTRIVVKDLYPGVKVHFNNDAFVNELKTAVSEHFTMFLQRGLNVKVNGTSIEPVLVEVLVTQKEDGPAPYVFQAEFDDVIISITVGLNTGKGPLLDGDDSSDFEGTRSSQTAGWTVFCNDRAVLVGDKTRLTGWGDGLPLYHYQFSIITGIVEFRSKKADKLPISTTKRNLDSSSEVWSFAKTKMKEGLHIWTTYTNTWKNHPRSDQTVFWKDAEPMSLRKTIETVSGRTKSLKSDGTIEYNPKKQKVMPPNPNAKPSSRRISFSRPKEELEIVSNYLFDKDDEKPGIIGDECFDIILKEAREEEAEHE